MKKILISTDGGSRGNPGPSASGYVVNGKSYGKYLGKTTNNIAEYTAIQLALEQARKDAGEHAWETTVEVRMDSQLAQRQLIGKYIHIPREENAAADKAVNDILDNH